MSKETKHQELQEEKRVDREEELFKKIQGCSFIVTGFITVLIVLILLAVRLYF